MNQSGSGRETNRAARLQAAVGVMAMALLVCGTAQAIAVIAIRYLVAGQVGLDGVDTYGPAVEGLKRVEGLVGPGIAVVVSLAAGSRAWGDLRSVNGKPAFSDIDWTWSFWMPILIGAIAFVIIYNFVFDNAVPGGRNF